MTQSPFRRALFLIAVTVFTGGLLGQTSPWPFPSRPGTGTGGAKPALTVGYWNIQWFPGRHPTSNAADESSQTASVHNDMKQIDVDILGLEEVRDWAHAAVAVEPLKGFKVDVCANFPPREGQTNTQEVAIASRLQPLSAWTEQWKPNGPLLPPRGFAFAAYEVAPRKLALVYALHLKSNAPGPEDVVALRQESMKQLLSHMEAMQKAYEGLGTISWIIGGDFNTAPDDTRFASETTTRTLMGAGFQWVWQGTPLSNRVTMPPDKRFPAACFDHIFYRGAKLVQGRVISTSAQSSDHRAVVASFDLP